MIWKMTRCLTLPALAVGALAAAPAPAYASSGDFYFGAGQVSFSITASYQKYDTSHLRLKAGYEFWDYLAIEAQFTGKGKDGVYLPAWDVYDRYRFNYGLGVYLKPKTNFPWINVYGIAGVAYIERSFGLPLSHAFGYGNEGWPAIGGGVEWNVTKRLSIDFEYMDGRATERILARSVGVRYRF
jgi:opacity protein-like surface antigen